MIKTGLWYTLYGKTGSGKTAVLESLKKQGFTVLNLERLANHKGSLFGGDTELQPSKQAFRAQCEQIIRQAQNPSPIFTEWKGKHIGKHSVPTEVISKIDEGAAILLERPIEERASRLIASYGNFPFKTLYHKLFLLKSRMLSVHFDAALQALDHKNIHAFVISILAYYDVCYNQHIQTLAKEKYIINCKGLDEKAVTQTILEQII